MAQRRYKSITSVDELIDLVNISNYNETIINEAKTLLNNASDETARQIMQNIVDVMEKNTVEVKEETLDTCRAKFIKMLWQ